MAFVSRFRGGVRSAAQRFGYDIIKIDPNAQFPSDVEADERRELEAVLPYTMTSAGQLASLRDAVRYVEAAKIPGDIVECGVWRGGSMMAAARMLKDLGTPTRHLYLFDTYAGMPEPTKDDASFKSYDAKALWEQGKKSDGSNDFCFASLEDVRANMASTGYPPP